MAGFNIKAKNAMLDELVSLVAYVSVHTAADPGENGSDEVSGGTYARQEVTWDTVSNGEVSMVGELEFDIPAGTTVRSIGLWSASTAGDFYGSQPIEADTYAVDGTLTLTALRLDLNG